jgi:hypothetical protein
MSRAAWIAYGALAVAGCSSPESGHGTADLQAGSKPVDAAPPFTCGDASCVPGVEYCSQQGLYMMPTTSGCAKLVECDAGSPCDCLEQALQALQPQCNTSAGSIMTACSCSVDDAGNLYLGVSQYPSNPCYGAPPARLIA